MKGTISILAAVVAMTAGIGLAQTGADVLKAKGCLNCHENDKKKVGPAFKDVAAKFKGNKGAEAQLVAKLKEGKGHMKIDASDADLKAAVAQVLATK